MYTMRAFCVVVSLLLWLGGSSESSLFDEEYLEDGEHPLSDLLLVRQSGSEVILDYMPAFEQHGQGFLGSDSNKRIQTVERYHPNTKYFKSSTEEDFKTSEEGEQSELERPLEQPARNPDGIAIERLTEKVDNLMSEVKAQQDKITELENANKKLENKLDLVEQQTKANNLIFFNVRESKSENHKTTLNKVLHILNKVMKVRTNQNDIAMALRANGNSTEDRPIIVKFTNFATRMKVMAARVRLSSSDVVVTGDYSEHVTQRRQQLLPFLNSARSQGHHAFLLYDALVVDGVRKTLEELQAEEKQEEATTVTEDCGCEESGTEAEAEPRQQEPDEQVEEVEVDPMFQDNEYDE